MHRSNSLLYLRTSGLKFVYASCVMYALHVLYALYALCVPYALRVRNAACT